ncbi:MAG TPA: winged helix-turn-helix transcriptional regulator [Nitrososphaeraceae archaeon]|jgi:DNA-binding Lrp family transcriptional regulator
MSNLVKDSRVLDKLDYQILNLMMLGIDNKNISEQLKTPLSTIQRRTRILLRSGYVNLTFQPNYKKLGLKKGLLHVYLRTGNMKKIADELLSSDGIMSAGVHVGNSDIVGEFVYEDSEQLVDLISHVKEMDEVERVLWSEEVYLLAGKKHSILAVLNRIIDRQ